MEELTLYITTRERTPEMQQEIDRIDNNPQVELIRRQIRNRAEELMGTLPDEMIKETLRSEFLNDND